MCHVSRQPSISLESCLAEVAFFVFASQLPSQLALCLGNPLAKPALTLLKYSAFMFAFKITTALPYQTKDTVGSGVERPKAALDCLQVCLWFRVLFK